MYHRIIVLLGWIIAPPCSAKTMLCGGRLGAYARGGILLGTKCLTSASLALFSESQTLR